MQVREDGVFVMELRDRIIETALTLFDEKGYHGVSINEIVKEAKTSKGGFYYHFSSKEELLYVIHDVFITYALDKVSAAKDKNEDPIKKLTSIIKDHLKVFHLYKSHLTVFYQESKYLRPEDREKIREKRKLFKQLILDVIQEGKTTGKFRAEINVEITSMAILGMVNWLYKWYRKDGVYSIEEIGDYYVDLTLHSVLTPEALKESQLVQMKQ